MLEKSQQLGAGKHDGRIILQRMDLHLFCAQQIGIDECLDRMGSIKEQSKGSHCAGLEIEVLLQPFR